MSDKDAGQDIARRSSVSVEVRCAINQKKRDKENNSMGSERKTSSKTRRKNDPL